MRIFLKTAIAALGAMLVSNILLAGSSNPPPPQPITCAGGNAVTGFSYGTPPTCGAPIAGGTINAGSAGQLTDYSAATAVSPITTGTGVVTALGVNTGSAGAFVVNGGDAGTPSALVGTNATGTAAGLTAGHVTTNANLTGDVSSVGNATTLANTAVTPGSYTNTNLTVDAKGRITAAATGAGGSGLTVGTSTITGGTTNRLFYDNAGVLGEAVVGTGLSLSGGNLTATGGGAATGVGVQAGQSPSNIGDNATALPAAHFFYGTNAAMTLPRTHALPDSATQGVGDIEIFDAQQTVTATNQLCVQAAGTDKLNGVTNGIVCITAKGGSLYLHNDAAGTYTTGAGANIPQPTDAQLILGKTGTPGNVLVAATMSQDCTITNAGVITCTKTNNVSFGALATTTPGTGVATAAAANLSAAGGLTTTIASGSQALNTAAISSATCDTVVSVTATNVATTDVVSASFNGDPTAVTGYIPATTGMLTIITYPTSGHVNFKVCNNTGSSITPGAITLNWRVAR